MRVLVVRPQPAADRTAARLAARGHIPIMSPLVEVRASDEACPPGPFRAILVTSQNAVDALGRERTAFESLPIFAVGARTASVLREAGFSDVRSADADAEALARAVAASIASPARLLHVAGQDRKPEPARSLAGEGFDVAVWAAYRAERATVLPERVDNLLKRGEVDVVLHFSRLSAEHLLRLGDEAGLTTLLAGLLHVCLSADIRDACKSLAIARTVVARRPDEDSLLEALDSAVSGPRVGSPPPQSG